MKHVVLPAALWLAACASHVGPPPVVPAPVIPRPAVSKQAAGPSAAAVAPASGPACRHPIPAACDGPPPAYAREVLPILQKRCFRCHTGDGVAADEHDFSRVDAVNRARTAIADEVSTCAMPPRSPLDDAEANALLRWVACAQKMN